MSIRLMRTSLEKIAILFLFALAPTLYRLRLQDDRVKPQGVEESGLFTHSP
jgi:hypothetical protein